MIYFYQSDALRSLNKQHLHTSIVRAKGQTLALQDDEGAVRKVCADRQGSALQVASFPQAFSPYGYLPAESSCEIGFAGLHLDRLTHLYPYGNGYRWYSPVAMRFLGPDYVSPFGAGGLNAYAFLGGDVVNRTDPDGHSPVPIGIQSLGRTTGRGVSAVTNVWRRRGGFINYQIDQNGGPSELIMGHGLPGSVAPMNANRTRTPKILRAEPFAEHMYQHGVDLSTKDKNILACFSADPRGPGLPSFIEELQLVTGGTTTGYRGPVKAAPIMDFGSLLRGKPSEFLHYQIVSHQPVPLYPNALYGTPSPDVIKVYSLASSEVPDIVGRIRRARSVATG